MCSMFECSPWQNANSGPLFSPAGATLSTFSALSAPAMKRTNSAEMRRKARAQAMDNGLLLSSDRKKLRIMAPSENPTLEEANSPAPSTTAVHLDSLPNPALVNVIQHLPWRDRVRVERVSRRWRRLCLDQGWDRLR